MIFLTSDTHFYHHNIIDYDQRPFKDIKDMHECLIENWNNVVGQEDIVYHLGDFGFGSLEQIRKVFFQLNGYVTIVRGSHDESMKRLMEARFCGICDEITINYKGFILILSHKPDLCHKDIDGVINIHGHSHHTERFNKNFINVSCNAWEYKPVSLDTLIVNYKKNKRG